MEAKVPVESWGVAAPATAIATLELVDDTAYFVTRSVEPTMLGALDVDAGVVDEYHEIPRGGGAWSTAALDGDVYVGTYAEGDIYRLETDRGELSHLVELPEDTHVCDLSVENGMLYAGSYPSASAYEIDPATGDYLDYGPACQGEQYARKITAEGDDVFVGIGSHAHLIRIDRRTGEREDVLPGALADEGFVWDPVVVGETLVYRTKESGFLVLADSSDPSDFRTVRPPGESHVGEFVVRENDVYLITSAGRELYRYDIEADTFAELGSAPGEAVGLYLRGTEFVGAGSDGTVWTHDYETGAATVTRLDDAGMPPGAEITFSLDSLEGVPVVAGHGRLHVHRSADADPAGIDAPGEAKAMTAVDDDLWLAFYTDAILASFAHDDGEVTERRRIGHDQNRPRAIHHHEATGRIYVGTMPEYGHLGGALSVYDPETGVLRVERDVVPDQSITSFASDDDTLFFGSEVWGGNGIDPVAEAARLAAWDVAAGEKRWGTTPISGAERVTHLSLVGDTLVGATSSGHLFAADRADGSVERRDRIADADDFWRPGEQLVAYAGDVYCLTETDLFRVDPETLSRELIASDLDPAVPMLAIDPDGTAYTLENRDLVSLSLAD